MVVLSRPTENAGDCIFRFVTGLRDAVRFASYSLMNRKTPTAMPQHTTTPSSNSTPRQAAMIAARQPKAETEEVAPDKSGPRRMLSEKQVLEIVPISRTTLFRMEKASRFPKSTYITPNRRVWFEDEIIAWQNAVDEFNPNRGRGKGRART
jgi:prophage regulatory protein